MIDEVLLEHEASAIDDVEQGSFERSDVDMEPRVEHLLVGDRQHFVVDALVRVDLK